MTNRRKVLYSLVYLLGFETIILLINTFVIQIHPIFFFIWPLGLFLFGASVNQGKKSRFDLALIIISLALYSVIAFSLVLDKPEGIIFDPEPAINMTLITRIILFESIALFVFDLIKRKSPLNYCTVIKFLGFASSIPWLSPLIVESIVLVQWAFGGSFFAKTSGKAIGGAGGNDVLCQYGLTNFSLAVSVVLFAKLMLELRRIMKRQRN